APPARRGPRRSAAARLREAGLGQQRRGQHLLPRRRDRVQRAPRHRPVLPAPRHGARVLPEPVGRGVVGRGDAAPRPAAPGRPPHRELAGARLPRRDHPRARVAGRLQRDRLRLVLHPAVRLPPVGARQRLRHRPGARDRRGEALRHQGHARVHPARRCLHRAQLLPRHRHHARHRGAAHRGAARRGDGRARVLDRPRRELRDHRADVLRAVPLPPQPPGARRDGARRGALHRHAVRAVQEPVHDLRRVVRPGVALHRDAGRGGHRRHLGLLRLHRLHPRRRGGAGVRAAPRAPAATRGVRGL
ncbi:MAG: hypothetical protein AVDCRST_MAG11-2161, partial [uncultured Gemmatimonadaceae bacterium]